MALSIDAEQILVLAQPLAPDDKLELAERLIADVRHHHPITNVLTLPHEADGETTEQVAFVRNDPPIDIATLPMVGIWSDNEEMADPVEWVRTTRQREWGGQR